MSTSAPDGRSARRRQRGAALLLLLMVLILGAAAMIVNVPGASPAARRQRQTLALLAQSREALLGFASAHGRLPRPTRNAEIGVEDAQACASEQQCTGFLPWRTLGLPPAYVGPQPLRYSVTPAFAADGAVLKHAHPSKAILGRGARGLYYLQGGQDCGDGVVCLPAVVIASGKYYGAPAGADQASNDRATRQFIQRAAGDDEGLPGGVFDDMLMSVPLHLLRQRTSQAGSWGADDPADTRSFQRQ